MADSSDCQSATPASMWPFFCLFGGKWRAAPHYPAPDIEATWFIDPPYEGAPGRNYRYRVSDYEALGAWCRTRRGQVLVCERQGATWLPFRPFRDTKALHGRGNDVSAEALWTPEVAA